MRKSYVFTREEPWSPGLAIRRSAVCAIHFRFTKHETANELFIRSIPQIPFIKFDFVAT